MPIVAVMKSSFSTLDRDNFKLVSSSSENHGKNMNCFGSAQRESILIAKARW